MAAEHEHAAALVGDGQGDGLSIQRAMLTGTAPQQLRNQLSASAGLLHMALLQHLPALTSRAGTVWASRTKLTWSFVTCQCPPPAAHLHGLRTGQEIATHTPASVPNTQIYFGRELTREKLSQLRCGREKHKGEESKGFPVCNRGQ